MSKRTKRDRKVVFASVESNTMYDSFVLRAFAKKNTMKHLTDKRKAKRRFRRALGSGKSYTFKFGLVMEGYND